jgi:hypothetical protein
LDFLPANVDRDDVREVARRYGPRRRRSATFRYAAGLIDFLARYSAPFIGLIAGAEYAAAKALYPLMGREERYGDSLRLFLGEDLGQKMADMGKAFEVTGTLVAATPNIVACALYGALIGIVGYYMLKWMLILAVFSRRRLKLRRKVAELVA